MASSYYIGDKKTVKINISDEGGIEFINLHPYGHDSDSETMFGPISLWMAEWLLRHLPTAVETAKKTVKEAKERQIERLKREVSEMEAK